MTINLVENGIFPIVYDNDGNKLNHKLDTNYDIPGTIQGEGKLTGTTTLFIRTSACNLRCIFHSDKGGSPCDTPYSSHKPEKNKVEIDDIISTVKNNLQGNIKHIVVSGGEPTMQKKPLGELLHKLQLLGLHTTIETNGTIYDDDIAESTNLFSISPKLSNSVPTLERFRGKEIEDLELTYNQKWEEKHDRLRINIGVMQKYIDSCYDSDYNGNVDYQSRRKDKDFQLKFVVTNEQDLSEIDTIIGQLSGVDSKDVLLMPEGYYPDDVMEKSKMVINMCLIKGYSFSTRMHTLLFGTKRGV